MQILMKISDNVAQVEGKDVPVVAMDMKSVESVEGMSEPTPAMWTAACVYDLFVTGKLLELTTEFIASQKQEAGGEKTGD
ncbi:hypothetical protein HNR26_002319 [Rhizobium rosettiformans]|uniref:Uncharacterized protein n=2 Tax=Rhizobium rosettiformans TaxID=1368430 RepID=A0A4S8PZ16_9HYPH|nr:hypothetical protein [Rhizobium rosettiformans]MBB5276267.1 hypothetical protein [Rhizobium rosettiformans]THV36900.1 hypothetical protein FAA86_10415 [Rhizobium rosettiformans W3]